MQKRTLAGALPVLQAKRLGIFDTLHRRGGDHYRYADNDDRQGAVAVKLARDNRRPKDSLYWGQPPRFITAIASQLSSNALHEGRHPADNPFFE